MTNTFIISTLGALLCFNVCLSSNPHGDLVSGIATHSSPPVFLTCTANTIDTVKLIFHKRIWYFRTKLDSTNLTQRELKKVWCF